MAGEIKAPVIVAREKPSDMKKRFPLSRVSASSGRKKPRVYEKNPVPKNVNNPAANTIDHP